MNWMGFGATRAAYPRRLMSGYYERYFAGRVLDLGCAHCPVTETCDRWDGIFGHGDATWLEGVAAESYDCVYASHLLEHLEDPAAALRRWWELVRPGGYLFIVVPDEDLYEQGRWPSIFNVDHKWTFTLDRNSTWSPVSITLATWWPQVLLGATLELLARFDTGYIYDGKVWDRTLIDEAEAHVELILRKA